MKRADAINFWEFMTSWNWSHDDELFWLQSFDPVTGSVRTDRVSVFSFDLGNRIKLLFELFSKLFPGLDAQVQVTYGASDELRKRGIANYGGQLTVSLSNAIVKTLDLPYT